MDGMSLYEFSAGYVLVLAMSTLRILTAFLITPLFTDELVPPLIKTSVFIALGIIVTFVHPPVEVDAFSGADWVLLFAKEMFIGAIIGFFFGLFLWAFESAGVIIDTQIGAAMAMIYDPLSGHEVTLYGDFLGRWIHYLFIATGGLMVFVIAVLESYVVWPMDRFLPDFQRASVAFIEEEFGRFVKLTVMISAPVLVVVFVIDMCLGLINRFAKRLDIVFVSMAIKNMVGLIMVLIMIPVLAQLLLDQLDMHNLRLNGMLERVLSLP